MNNYRLQVALKSGSGFEFITDLSEQAVIDEFAAAKAEVRKARIASKDNVELAVFHVDPHDISAWLHTPVQKVARV